MYSVDVPIATDTSDGALDHYGFVVLSRSIAFLAYSNGNEAWSGYLQLGAGEVDVEAIELLPLPGLLVTGMAVGEVGPFSTVVALEGTNPLSTIPFGSFIGIQFSDLGSTKPVLYLAIANKVLRAPAVAGARGEYFVAFTVSDKGPDGSPVGTPVINIYDHENNNFRAPGLSGSHPAIAISDSGLYLTHTESGEVFFGQSSDSGASFATTSVGSFDVADLKLQASAGGDVHLLIVTTSGELYHATGNGGSLSAPALVTTGVSSAELSLTGDGDPQVSISGSGGARVLLGNSLSIDHTFAAGITKPYVTSDAWGYANVLYTNPEGEIHYTNNAPLPVASFSATPLEGKVPLPVAFHQVLTDPVISLLWDFGDGTVVSSGRSSQMEHTYEVFGAHTVSLTAIGPGGSHTLTRTQYVSVAPATEVFRLPRIRVFPGQTDVTVPILYTHNLAEVQGFQFAGRFDPTVLTLKEITVANTRLGRLRRDTEIFNIFDTSFVGGVLFLSTEPFPPEGVFLARGTEKRLVHTVWDVSPSVPVGTETVVVLEGQDEGVRNVYSQDGLGVPPHTVDGVFEIVGADENDLFIRGDCNMDGVPDTSDAISILQFVFRGVKENARRLDACDVNDSGAVDISDAINVLGFLFSGSKAPPHPWPTLGLDPTDDTLPFAP